MNLEMKTCTYEISETQNEIKIIPIGLVKSQKGDFTVDDESIKLMKEAFAKKGVDIVVDYEHQTLENVQAPAGGWIKDFYIKDNAIVAKIEWTQKAKEYIKNKEYRYLSPVVMVRKSDNKAVELHSIALTNTPAIQNMYPIINSLGLNNQNKEGEEKMELLKELITALELDENTTEDELIKNIKEIILKKKQEPASETEVVANKEILKMLELKEDADIKDVTSKIMQLKNPESNINVEEFKQLKLKLEQNEADGLVMQAMKEGKITATQKQWATEYALKAPDGFKEYLKTASVVVPMGEIKTKVKDKNLSETDMKMCKLFGLSKEDIEKYGKDEC